MNAGPASTQLGFRGGLLKAAVVVPDLVISGLLSFVMLAALPADVAVGFVAVVLLLSIVIVAGRAEGLCVRVLHGARRPTQLEARQLAAPIGLVASRSGCGDLQVLVGGGAEPVSAAGRRHVILHRQVLNTHRAGRITDAEVAALLARGVGRLLAGQPRIDLLITLWTLPWDFLRGIAGIGRQFAWIPLVRFAWRTRLLVGTIAVVLEAHAGRWPSPIVIAAFIALSYLMPKARSVCQGHLGTMADLRANEVCSRSTQLSKR